MDLRVRLNILKDAGQISETSYKAILEMIKQLEENRGITLTEDNGAMFITHLCAALTRIERGELVNKIDDLIFDEIKNDTNYAEAVEITTEIETLTGKIPEQERDFIEMHICTLLNN